LPGVGDYTAAAVASFAYQQRHAVLDTNVRRVHARLLDAQEFERPGAPTKAERTRALALLPQDSGEASQASIAVMELGALVCAARTPSCHSCPVESSCAWVQAGRPGWSGPARKGQTYAGTDRQCRGRILQVVREAQTPVPRGDIENVWDDGAQRTRALASLLADELIEEVVTPRGRAYRLPL
jgi:A/G-specific adenine glycosylase